MSPKMLKKLLSILDRQQKIKILGDLRDKPTKKLLYMPLLTLGGMT